MTIESIHGRCATARAYGEAPFFHLGSIFTLLYDPVVCRYSLRYFDGMHWQTVLVTSAVRDIVDLLAE